ncbi:rubrerythrin [Geothermobacter ehrlichii]|uniref:Rubrerythrin n=1 Tax=Geothermobacter ehrlichii TaxID=213224 RepID=A0A5D3WIK7_9BACT|nr:ferritin family protein [Geothermobacter ehrlichii]TYO98709.1 rubrerythrin [Geothermobacter ehrlichii]
MERKEQLKAIVDLALSIDRKAEAIYHQLSNQADNDELKDFWQLMAEEEAEHNAFWVELNRAIDKGKIPMIFDDPRETFFELLEIDKRAAELVAVPNRRVSVGDAFRTAYKMEFYLLHPTFEVLFQLAEENAGIPSPDEDYQNHIRQFLEGFARFGGIDLSLELAGEFLVHVWRENRRTAKRMVELYGYRSIIPSCAGCGKIRDEQGKWVSSDSFIRESLHKELTHGVCPTCMKELYPEVPAPEGSGTSN